MRIQGIENLYPADLYAELQRGGRFVRYDYCISLIVVTMRQPTDIYFVRAGESAVVKGLKFTLLSLVLGWWGIPWGPVFTIAAVATNLQGGKDVTSEVAAALLPPAAPGYGPLAPPPAR